MRDSITSARIGVAQTNADGLRTQEFCFRADDPTFAGHFPTRPILPGVFQLEMARMMAEEILSWFAQRARNHQSQISLADCSRREDSR